MNSRTYLAALVLAPMLGAQNGPNQPQPPVQSDLLDQLVGLWAITGTTRGQPVHEGADAEWVLGHQFLRIHRQQIDGPSESVVHVGFDTVLQRFVAFRLDTNGAHGAEYPGYGLQKGDNKLEFSIQYPSGPWRETWTWDAKEKTWQFLVEIERKDPKGSTWSTFSSLTLRSVRRGRVGPGRGFGPQPPHPQTPPQAPPVP
ncbi:MAG TPA: hypothetical protein VGG72_23840 [Bryobacteraceae bacterium]|jgi:hypothetical protein